MVVSRSTSPLQAAEQAKKLVGSYAHLRPGDPGVFMQSIADVLEQYPLGVVLEACDARTGAARKIEFLTVRAVVEYLDARMEFWSTVAKHVPREAVPALPAPRPLSPQHRAGMIERFRGVLARLTRAPDPITSLIRAHKRQSEARHAADRARALADLQAAE